MNPPPYAFPRCSGEYNGTTVGTGFGDDSGTSGYNSSELPAADLVSPTADSRLTAVDV